MKLIVIGNDRIQPAASTLALAGRKAGFSSLGFSPSRVVLDYNRRAVVDASVDAVLRDMCLEIAARYETE